VVGLLLACGLALTLRGPGLARWLGTALLLGGAWELRDLVRMRTSALRRAAPFVLVSSAFIALFWELLAGRPPATRDHAIHYVQTRLLWDELIPSGRLWGWSPTLGAGYPFGESYPVLGYLLGGLPNALSLGVIGPRASYALGIAFTWAVGTVAVGWLAYTIVTMLRPRSPGAARWAFCVGGLLWLFDPGASRQGGWNYLLFHGVWPQMFSAVLWALSLTLSHRALRRPSPRRIALAALVLGAGIAAHPFGMLAAAASAGLLLVALVVSREGMPAPLRTWALVHGGAAAVSAGVVVVFLGSAGGMARSPVQWSPLGQLSYEMLGGSLFPTHWAWLGPLFVLGTLAIVRRPSSLGTLAVLLCAALVVLGSHESMTVLRLDLLVSAFKNLQFPRYTIELKPVMFAVAGVGAVLLPAALRSVIPPVASRSRAWLLAAIAAPFIASVVPDAGRLQTRPVGALDTLEANPEGAYEAQIAALLLEEREALGQRLRVAYLRTGMGGGTFPLFAIADANARVVLDGHIAAVNFKHRIRRVAKGYDALGVTHVIYDRPLEDEEAFASRLTELGKFGRYRVARYTPEQTMPRATTDHGEIEVVTDTPEHVVAEVVTDKPTRVIFRQAPHLRWQATLDGAPLEINEAKRVTGLTLLTVEVPSSGQLELTYSRTPLERAAGWLSVLACVAGMLALALGQPLRFRTRPLPRRLLVPAVVLLACVAIVAVSAVQAGKLERTWQHFAADRAYRNAASPTDEDAATSDLPIVVRDLVDDGAFEFRRSPQRVCNGLQSKNVLPGCSEAEHAPVTATTYRAPYLYRCVEFGVPPGGSVEVVLGDGTHDVLGRLTRRLLGSPGRHLVFGVGRKPKKLRVDEVDFFAPAKGEPPVAVLYNGGRHIERFCLAAAEVARPS
jgi:hypothetical protein